MDKEGEGGAERDRRLKQSQTFQSIIDTFTINTI